MASPLKQRIDNIFNALELQIEIPADVIRPFGAFEDDSSDGSLEAPCWKYPSPVDPKLTQVQNTESRESEYDPSQDSDEATEEDDGESSGLEDLEAREPIAFVKLGWLSRASRSDANVDQSDKTSNSSMARRFELIALENDYEADDELEDELPGSAPSLRDGCYGGKTKPRVVELPVTAV